MGWPTWTPGVPAWIGPEAAGYGSGTWRSPGYRSAKIRGRWCKVFFVAVACLAAFTVIYWLVGMSNAANDAAGFKRMTYDELDSWVSAAKGLGAWAFMLSLGLVIAIPAWFSRTVDNLPPLAGGTPRHSPGESIVWWFVPLANLVLPFMMVREAWHRYATPSRHGNAWTIVAWWITYNVGFTIGFIAFGMVFGEQKPDQTESQLISQIQSGLFLGVLGFGLIFAAAVLGFYIVNELGHRAGERAAMFGLDAPEARWAGGPGYFGPMPGGPVAPYPPTVGYGAPMPGQYPGPFAPSGPPPGYPPYPMAPAPGWGAPGPMPQAPAAPAGYPQPGPAMAEVPLCKNCSAPLVPGQAACQACGTPVS